MKAKSELPSCPVATTVGLIGSKWKLLIIRNLSKCHYRFNELRRSLDGISQKVLTVSLRELEKDGIAYRKDYSSNPPRVEYGLSPLGAKLHGILGEMAKFGDYYKRVAVHTDFKGQSPEKCGIEEAPKGR